MVSVVWVSPHPWFVNSRSVCNKRVRDTLKHLLAPAVAKVELRHHDDFAKP